MAQTDEKEVERKHEGDICDTFSDFEAEYEKIKTIGRTGQYGTTWLCRPLRRDPSIPHSVENPAEVAVKIINKQRFKDSGDKIYAKWKELQRNEITTLLLTRHPNIVRLYRVLEDEDSVYMVMEYLNGGELLNYISKHSKKLSEFRIAHIMGQVLAALDYMHQRDILHLDLKPENIMLLDDEAEMPSVKLIDFGFAAILPRLEKMVGHRGTPYYMAPEVWRGQYDRAADVWAVGIICFVMLFGFLPFYNDQSSRGGKPNTREIKRKIQRGFSSETKKGCGPWFPKNIPVSGGAKRFVDHMLRKDISQRYTVVEALGDPWCRGHAGTDTLPDIVMRGLATFVGATERSRDLTHLVADHTDPTSTTLEQTGSLEALYSVDGKIPFNVFADRTQAITNMRPAEMHELFHELDTDGDGYLSVDTMKRVEAFHQLVSVDDRLMELFERLDKDGDGVLNELDLQMAVDDSQARSFGQVLSARRILDNAGSNVIDREKFLELLHPQNYTRVIQSVQEARNASQYGISLRMRSALYYDLLRQCEEQDHPLHPDEAEAELREHLASKPGLSLALNQMELDVVEEMDEDETPFSDDEDGDELNVDAVLENVEANAS